MLLPNFSLLLSNSSLLLSNSSLLLSYSSLLLPYSSRYYPNPLDYYPTPLALLLPDYKTHPGIPGSDTHSVGSLRYWIHRRLEHRIHNGDPQPDSYTHTLHSRCGSVYSGIQCHCTHKDARMHLELIFKKLQIKQIKFFIINLRMQRKRLNREYPRSL